MVVVACSGTPASPPPLAPIPHRAPPRPLPPPDAAPEPAPLGTRGDACTADHACAADLLCGPLPGGYCLSACGVTGNACDGTCVETARAGELCMKSCARDADCRGNEGYTCDPVWHACTLPNMAAIQPKQCPGDSKRDPAFAAAEAWSSSSAPGLYQFEPASVLADDGGIVSMYISRGSMFEGNTLGLARSDGKGKATLDAPVKSQRQSMFDPWLARDAKGAIYAVWYAFDGRDANGEIDLVTSKDRGATWSAPNSVHDPDDCKGTEAGCLDKPMIAIGGKPERVYVMYSANDAGLRVRTSTDGGASFGKPVTALEGIYGDAHVGADGKLHVVTLNGGPMGAFGSAQQTVQYAVSSDGGATFSKPLTVSARDEMLPFFFSNPSLAVDDARRWLYFAYARGGRDAKWDIALAATKDGGKTWVRTSLGDGCAIHMVPNLALDPTTGTLHVAYYDSQGAPGRYVHASCTPGLAKCTVQGAINSQPFAALSTERHGSKWIGEYEGLVVDARRRVLHAVWSQPVKEGDRVVSRIFHAAAKLK